MPSIVETLRRTVREIINSPQRVEICAITDDGRTVAYQEVGKDGRGKGPINTFHLDGSESVVRDQEGRNSVSFGEQTLKEGEKVLLRPFGPPGVGRRETPRILRFLIG